MQTSPLSYDSDRLIREWRERYTTRRTTNRQMLDEAELLVRNAIAAEREQEARQAKTDRERDLERREREVAYAEQRGQWQIDHLRLQLAEAEAKIESLSSRATLMREERETVADGTVVRLTAPTVPSYGDQTVPRPWMLGELEEVLLRLRMAGGADTTEVRFKRDAIEACVTFPEAALTPITQAVPERPALRDQHINGAVLILAAIVVVALIGLGISVWL